MGPVSIHPDVEIGTGDLLYGDHIRGRAVIADPFILPLDGADLLISQPHGVIESRADQIEFIRAMDDLFLDRVRDGVFGDGFERGDQVRPAHLVEAPFHPAETYVREIPDPLEIGNRDAARIDINIRQDGDPFGAEDLVSIVGYGPVRRFDDQAGGDTVCVCRRNLSFHGGGDQDMTIHLECGLALRDIVPLRKTLHSAIFDDVLSEFFHGHAFFIDDGAVPFDYRDNAGLVLFLQQLRRVIADITKTLDDDTLAA